MNGERINVVTTQPLVDIRARANHMAPQDPDMPPPVVEETDAGIVVRGAKYETAACANQALTSRPSPTGAATRCPPTRSV